MPVTSPPPTVSADDKVCVFLDTESSVCLSRRRRVLVSIAYQVVDVHGTVYASHYELVWQCPAEYRAAPQSVAIHRISAEESQAYGQPLASVLHRFFACVERHRATAIVGHDIGGDLALLVSEAVTTAGMSPDAALLLAMIPRAAHLVCTRMLATHHCAIPLPAHLSTEPWVQLLERFTRRRHGRAASPSLPLPPGVAPVGSPAVDDDGDATAYKWPSLRESYETLVKKPTTVDSEGPHGVAGGDAIAVFPMHDARGDVDRCKDVFLTLYARGG